ncbi:MAG: PLDc N-terminal domain-containing protein [Candidatus Lokiarchaeota archaeon]|nr:PLDc N-terminal domain-containing protein [Candidatus Lokiarchaeota archaeon]
MILHTYDLCPLHWVFMLVGGIVYFVISLLIARYMHKDAIKRGIKNSEIWLLIGFFLNLIGLVLYLFVRKNYDERP